MRSVRVLIVEDSAVVREHLKRIVSADPRLEVAGAVASGEEALRVLDQAAPDVISMDIRLPGMQGFEATRRIMCERPTPIVVVSGIDSDEMNLTMEALKAGALAVVEKPPSATHADYEALAARLCTQLVIMSEVRVVRQRSGRRFERLESPVACVPRGMYRILAVAASTGGPNALMELLGALGGRFPLPVVVVQHMTSTFMNGFGVWLAGVSPLPVEIVTARTKLEPGRVYLAAADRHVAAGAAHVWPDDTAPVGNHRPSGNVLFSSVARAFGPAGIGVLLTGMGEDGARGLLEMRRAGGYTIAEHESTAVVYGMPAAGVRSGAACEARPLQHIGPRILELVAGAGEMF